MYSLLSAPNWEENMSASDFPGAAHFGSLAPERLLRFVGRGHLGAPVGADTVKMPMNAARGGVTRSGSRENVPIPPVGIFRTRSRARVCEAHGQSGHRSRP